MGNCAPSNKTPKEKGRGKNWTSTAKVIQMDGRLQEFRQPIKASHILSKNPSCFLCSSESMHVDSHAPPVPGHEDLQLGQLYFIMPISMSHSPLSLHDLCSLAITASSALANADITTTNIATKTSRVRFHTAVPHQDRCRIAIGFDTIRGGTDAPARRGGRGELINH